MEEKNQRGFSGKNKIDNEINNRRKKDETMI